MPESQYVLPPEYHWFERDAKHLAIDPQISSGLSPMKKEK
jgi:hypothetical protein